MAPRHAVTRRGLRRSVRIGVFALAGLLVVGSGGAYAAFRYEQAQADRILPGVVISGVDVGEMTREEAVAAVDAAVRDELEREIEVSARGRTWHVKPSELGVTAEVSERVDAALAIAKEMSWTERAFHRFFDRPLGTSLDVPVGGTGPELKRFLRVVDEAITVSASNASIELLDGELVAQKPRFGVGLDRAGAAKELRRAVRRGTDTATLPVRKTEPKVTAEELGETIVVRISENRLYVYDGLKVTKTYDVATGEAGYPTPRGTWNIWDKRENPTWVNPAPDGWGKDLPAVIGPGPGNPLGTHALYLDAPGIRIHGTYNEASIGTYASHGCIRMTLADSKELFGMIDIGTQVLIVD